VRVNNIVSNSCNDYDISKFNKNYFTNSINDKWKSSTLQEESSLHQISPYIGKMKPSMARVLISEFTTKDDTIYEPFCGSGTVAFEAWAAGRNIISNDLSPYAYALTNAKLFPPITIDDAYSKNRFKKDPYMGSFFLPP
jgi:DNA modification methylase